MTYGQAGFSNLVVEVYQAFSTTARPDPLKRLLRATVQSFSTYFPSGLYGTASIFIPIDITSSFLWHPGDRIVIRNGLTIVWEGEIGDIGYSVGFNAEEGITLDCVGYWGALLGKRTINRRWCDTRISANVWEVDTSQTNGGETATYDRSEGRLQITPKAQARSTNDDAELKYTAPTGETVGRIAGTRDFQEAAQNWSMTLYEADSPFNFFSVNTSGSAAFDVDHSGTPRQTNYLQLRSLASQTPASDGTQYARLTGLKVYRYTSTDATVPDVRIDNIVKDMQAAVSDVNSDTAFIDTPGSTFDIEPFYTEGQETWASVLNRAASFGDGASPPNDWYIRLIDSEQAGTPDGKPVVECKQYPALTDYDYGIRLDEENLIPPLDIRRSASNIANWIVIQYRDIDEERDVVRTPDDEANLTDSTSTTDWGRRDLIVNIGEADNTTALNIGRRILAARKDAKFFVDGPITVRGYIRAKNGNPVPASQIQAGKRIKIENYLTDLVGVSGAGLTFHITRTDYTDEDETCRIHTGVPNTLSSLLAQLDLKFA